MWEILYDMVHNSIYGNISLITGAFPLLYYALFGGLYLIWKHYQEKYDLSRLKKFLAKNWSIRKRIFLIAVIAGGVSIVTFVLFLFKDFRVEHKRYNYIQTEMAEQKSVDILFLNEIQIELNEDENSNENEALNEKQVELNKCMQKLHITAESPITEITDDEIQNRIAIFIDIYQAETKTSGIDSKTDTETEDEGQETKLKLNGEKSEKFSKYQDEYEDWSDSFASSGSPSELYQISRTARDMLEVGRNECDYEELLKIAAEAVYRSECFLECDNRNVNTEKEPVIIEAKDILFYNGKVFYQLYMEAENRKEIKEYRNDFIVNAYVCMFLAGKMITKNDDEYAKVNYYIGNTREKMLTEIPTEDEFYKENIKDGLVHYRIALDCLLKRPDYYDKESNMEKNCQDGINTLNGS